MIVFALIPSTIRVDLSFSFFFRVWFALFLGRLGLGFSRELVWALSCTSVYSHLHIFFHGSINRFFFANLAQSIDVNVCETHAGTNEVCNVTKIVCGRNQRRIPALCMPIQLRPHHPQLHAGATSTLP